MRPQLDNRRLCRSSSKYRHGPASDRPDLATITGGYFDGREQVRSSDESYTNPAPTMADQPEPETRITNHPKIAESINLSFEPR